MVKQDDYWDEVLLKKELVFSGQLPQISRYSAEEYQIVVLNAMLPINSHQTIDLSTATNKAKVTYINSGIFVYNQVSTEWISEFYSKLNVWQKTKISMCEDVDLKKLRSVVDYYVKMYVGETK